MGVRVRARSAEQEVVVTTYDRRPRGVVRANHGEVRHQRLHEVGASHDQPGGDRRAIRSQEFQHQALYWTDVIVACRMVRRHFPSNSLRQTSVKRRLTNLPGLGAVSRGFTTSSPMITT